MSDAAIQPKGHLTRSVSEAAHALRAGGLVAFPTETVYGLGADATSDTAVASIFAAKERPRFNPLIVHISDSVHASEFVELSVYAQKLADAFWPGPLTLVLPRRSQAKLSLLVSAGLDTVAVRVPAHPLAQSLLKEVRLPLAAPSANPSGTVSATTAEHVAMGLGSKLDLILDGGATPVGIESTIIGFRDGVAVLLRPGAIPREAIEAITGPLQDHQTGIVSAPGQLASHYAPRASVRLNAQEVRPGESLLAFGAPLAGTTQTLNLSAKGDLKEAAANLFAMLRSLDETASAIAVMPIPHTGLGEAINDRLQRAAAPRS